MTFTRLLLLLGLFLACLASADPAEAGVYVSEADPLDPFVVTNALGTATQGPSEGESPDEEPTQPLDRRLQPSQPGTMSPPPSSGGVGVSAPDCPPSLSQALAGLPASTTLWRAHLERQLRFPSPLAHRFFRPPRSV